jgi:hypothetical protein
MLKPGPVKLMEGDLGAVSKGIKCMMDGRVSEKKLTYRIVDTLRN